MKHRTKPELKKSSQVHDGSALSVRAPPAGDQPENWRATNPRTGGHQPEHWLGRSTF